ncbi:DUF3761 domain-containing protein [Nocardia sp.]|uniref:DUF3761 domain-containing protein n=1 Tax=Nocardia sp. TaxID=1821 RepID=UPI00261984FB|nr:DUF3761 domain-containing protein [Nocardia sp.]
MSAVLIGSGALLGAPATAAPLLHTACTASEYQNVDNDCVPRPQQAPSAPPGATALCKDGDYSFSENHRGTCSGHHGVAQWL